LVLAKFKFPIPGVNPRPNGKPAVLACAALEGLADACVSPVAVAVVELADVFAAAVSVLGARITKCIVTPSFISIHKSKKNIL
jgi:hypothetical protein